MVYDNENLTESEVSEELKVKEAQIEYNKLYTYSDYLTWDDDVRRELIDGVVYLMSAPTWRHQEISGNLFYLLKQYLKDSQCKVFFAALDVRLNAGLKDDTVVQPDIMMTCDLSILTDRGIKGVPDLLVEVLSPSTSRYDRVTKYNKYLEVGVKEYWIVDPVKKSVAVNILQDGVYITHAYTESDSFSVHILKDCVIDLAEVFDIYS